MNIKTASIYRYKIPLLKPLSTTAHATHRHGLIVEFGSKSGRGFGEIAPLPGLHNESVSEVESEVISFFLNWKDRAFYAISELSPSARFGVESAYFHLQSVAKNTTLQSLWGAQAIEEIPLNAMIDTGDSSPEKTVLNLVSQGYGTIKIKVGKLSLAKDIRRVYSVCKSAGNSVLFRIDANRGFSLHEAIEFCHALKRFSVEYMEEPLKNLDELKELTEATNTPVALDETIHQPLQSEDFGNVSAIVLKPSRLGLRETLEWISKCRTLGIKCVLSSCFESGLGLCMLASLASIANSKKIAAGLSTFSWFEHDIASPPFRPFRGRISITAAQRWMSEFAPEKSSCVEKCFEIGLS